MAALREAAVAETPERRSRLATRITQALTTRSFRQHAGDWSLKDDGNGEAPDLCNDIWAASGAPSLFRNPDRHRPIIQRLAGACDRMAQAATSVDAFVYEPVMGAEHGAYGASEGKAFVDDDGRCCGFNITAQKPSSRLPTMTGS